MADDVKKYPEWLVLWDAIGTTMQPGQHLSWESLSEGLGLEVRRGRGYAQFGKFRRALESRRGLQLRPVKGEGYRVALPEEVPLLVQRRMELGGRQHRRAKRASVAAVVSTETPVSARDILTGMLFHIARVEQALRTEMKQLRQIASGKLPAPVQAAPQRALPKG